MEVTKEMVMEELRRVAFAQADDRSSSALKYASKLRALEILGKPLGAFEQQGDGGAVVIIDDVCGEPPLPIRTGLGGDRSFPDPPGIETSK